MKTIFNNSNVDTSKQPIFFGEQLGIQRLDKLKYPVFYDLYKKQMSYIWRPTEISLVKDAADYELLSENEKFIFSSNLKFQTLMDSCISRGVEVLFPHISIPELEYCCKAWTLFECIHSESYMYIIENVYPDFSAELDSITENQEIMRRGQKVKEWYDKLLNVDESDKYETLYKTLISINILEAIQFFVSFACSFAFGNQKKMVGDATIIKLIRRDENLHLKITSSILNILRKEESEGFQDVIRRSEKDVLEMFANSVDEEKSWARYLFQNGTMLGLNEAVLCEYIEWLCNMRLKTLKLPQLYPKARNTMSGWLDTWMGQKTQTAPQEDENTEYKIGQTLNNISGARFQNLSLLD